MFPKQMNYYPHRDRRRISFMATGIYIYIYIYIYMGRDIIVLMRRMVEVCTYVLYNFRDQ